MENNNEQPFTKEVIPVVPLENKESQVFRPESFFADIQKSINEGELVKQEEEQSNVLAGLENFGEQCGLTKDEAKKVLEEKGFTERLTSLRDKVTSSCDKYISKVRKVGAVATTALVFGVATPVYSYATEQVPEPERIEKEVLPTYEEAMTGLHKSVLTDKNERLFVSVRDKDGTYKSLSLREGRETSASVPEEAIDVVENGGEIEIVHTHPLELSTFSGVMSREEIEKAREGNGLPRVLPPSGDADFMSAIGIDVLAQKTGGVAHYKVIDSTGEWSYEISDRNAPFIRIMGKMLDQLSLKSDDVVLSPDEKEYVQVLLEKFPDQRFLIAELKTRSASDDNIAKKLLGKVSGLEGTASKIFESANKDELASMDTFSKYLFGNYFHTAGANAEDMNREDVEFYERTAKELGFSLKYTPNKKME